MQQNQTHAYLLARMPLSTLQFGGTLASADKYLEGAGSVAADGFPVPYAGILQSLSVWDGTILRTDFDQINLAAGDRISVYCDDTGTDSTIKVYKNGAASGLQALAVGRTATIQVTVSFSQFIV